MRSLQVHGRRPAWRDTALTTAKRRGASPRSCARSSSANASLSAATPSGGTRRKPYSYPLIVGTCATTQRSRRSVAPSTSACPRRNSSPTARTGWGRPPDGPRDTRSRAANRRSAASGRCLRAACRRSRRNFGDRAPTRRIPRRRRPRSPRQDDFPKGPIVNQMAQGFARLSEGIDPLDDRLD
jgi:hypothetical protein